MLDIDFLRRARPQLRAHVVYRYRSGYWKATVRARCAAIYQSRQRPLLATEDPEQIWATSLLGPQFVFYEIPPGVLDRTVVTQLLAHPPPHSLGLWLPATDPVCQTPAWGEWVKRVSCIEEAAPVASNLAAIVGLLAQQLAPEIWQRLRNPAELIRICQRHRQTRSREQFTVPLLAQLVEVVLRTALRPDGRGIDPAQAAQRLQALPGRAAPFAAELPARIGELCITPSTRSLTRLVRAVDAALFQHYLEPHFVVSLLLRTTHDLGAINARLNPSGRRLQASAPAKLRQHEALRRVPLESLLLWSVYLHAAEPLLRTRPLVLTLHEVGTAWLDHLQARPRPTEGAS